MTAERINYLPTARMSNPTVTKITSRRSWWTSERIAKLRYVMEKYGDPYKASRVLGCTPRTAMSAWREMKRKDAEMSA